MKATSARTILITAKPEEQTGADRGLELSPQRRRRGAVEGCEELQSGSVLHA
jgi:hypothetical protein